MYNTAPPTGLGVVGGVLATTGSETAGFTFIAIALLITGALILRASYIKKHRAA